MPAVENPYYVFSNGLDPDQRALVGDLWSGFGLFENVNRFSGISKQVVKTPLNQTLVWPKVKY